MKDTVLDDVIANAMDTFHMIGVDEGRLDISASIDWAKMKGLKEEDDTLFGLETHIRLVRCAEGEAKAIHREEMDRLRR